MPKPKSKKKEKEPNLLIRNERDHLWKEKLRQCRNPDQAAYEARRIAQGAGPGIYEGNLPRPMGKSVGKKYEVEEQKFLGPKGDRIKWVVEKGERPSFLKERKIPRSPSADVHQFIHDFLPEFIKIWQAIKVLGSIPSKIREDQKKAALECFCRNKHWNWITEEALKSISPWLGWRDKREKEDFRGRLLQVLIEKRFPKLRGYGAEMLEKIARGFESDVK